MRITPKQYARSLYESARGLGDFEIEVMLQKFVQMLARNNDLSQTYKIIQEFTKIYNQEEGIIEVEVVSTFSPSDSLAEKLAKVLNKKIELKKKVDSSLIGGLRLRFADNLIDGSVQKKLTTMKNSFSKI